MAGRFWMTALALVFTGGCDEGDGTSGDDVLAEDVSAADALEEFTGPCTALACEAYCRSAGFTGGRCRGEECRCYGGGDPDAGADADADADSPDEAGADSGADADAPPGACSGHGTPMTWGSVTVCACARGYTPSTTAGTDCVPTSSVCAGGAINYDVDGDGTNDTRFDPSPLECEMYELINLTRATHDDEGSPECHTPLAYSVEWSAHARNHSMQMSDRGSLFHADYPSGQNCAYGCDPACEMDMYMNGAGEDHCPPLSHHCNIMRCGFSAVGVGYWTPESGTFNTQNFL